MPGLELGLSLIAAPDVLAYGPAPGLEFIPYFLGLLAWAGLALAAVLFSPITAFFRRLRKGRQNSPTAAPSEPAEDHDGPA